MVNYRIYPIVIIAFFKVAIAFTLELAVPLYFIRQGLAPSIIGMLSSASSMIYLFSPVVLNKLHRRIGIKKTLIISAIGSFSVLFTFQFSLEPLLVYILLICEGGFAGLFWPVLISNISIISGSEQYCEDEESKDELMRSYNVAWNSGAIFSYFVGTLFLFFIDEVRFLFNIVFIYGFPLVIFVFLFQDPKSLNFEYDVPVKSNLRKECSIGNFEFPKLLPLVMIAFYGLLIGALLVLYPIKSEKLNLIVYTTYLFNLFRMILQTITISISTNYKIKTFKRLILSSFIVLASIFFIFGIINNLIVFGILFVLFGIFGSLFYAFSFKLVIYQNILENTSKYSAYFETLSGVGFFIGPIIVGFIAQFELNSAFFFISILVLVMFILYLLIINKIKQDDGK